MIDDANGVAVMKVSDDVRPHVCRRVVVADSALRVRVGDRLPVKAIAGDVAHKKKNAIASLVMGFPFDPLQSL